MEKISSTNLSFENEQNKKYRYLKEKYHQLAEKKNDWEAEINDYISKIQEQNAIIAQIQEEKQDLLHSYNKKNKDYEKLYRELCKNKEESDLNLIKSKSECEKLVTNFRELEKKFQKEREINQNLENYNSKLLEENEIVTQEKLNAKSK